MNACFEIKVVRMFQTENVKQSQLKSSGVVNRQIFCKCFWWWWCGCCGLPCHRCNICWQQTVYNREKYCSFHINDMVVTKKNVHRKQDKQNREKSSPKEKTILPNLSLSLSLLWATLSKRDEVWPPICSKSTRLTLTMTQKKCIRNQMSCCRCCELLHICTLIKCRIQEFSIKF